MRLASWISLGMIVTRLAWIAHRLVSSKSPTRYASAASWSAATAELWNRRSVLKSWAISRTRRWKGSFRIRSSVLFWYFRISLRATVPGLNLWGFFTPPVAGADFLAAFVANCFLGALPPVDLRAVCLVRAIEKLGFKKWMASVSETGVVRVWVWEKGDGGTEFMQNWGRGGGWSSPLICLELSMAGVECWMRIDDVVVFWNLKFKAGVLHYSLGSVKSKRRSGPLMLSIIDGCGLFRGHNADR